MPEGSRTTVEPPLTLDHRRLLDVLPQAVLVVDGHGLILFASAGVTRVLGWPAAGLAGRSLVEVIRPQPVAEEPQRAPVDPSAPKPKLYMLQRSDGTRGRFEVER